MKSRHMLHVQNRNQRAIRGCFGSQAGAEPLDSKGLTLSNALALASRSGSYDNQFLSYNPEKVLQDFRRELSLYHHSRCALPASDGSFE
jgi:hypothetical protein